MVIKYVTIYGERCSGTNYLEELILNNFNLELTWKYGWKHFFGFYDFSKNDLTNELTNELTNDENKFTDETLFIGIVRNPVEWLYSFFLRKYHIPPENGSSIEKFLLNEFYSIDETNNIMINDLNYITNVKYKNIFEMRKLKNEYLKHIMPTKVKNYILINYESLLLHPKMELNKLKNDFNLIKKNKIFKNILYYKKRKNIKFIPKPNKFCENVLNIIKNNLDLEQEKSLNYDI